MALEDLDVLELERRARRLGEVIDTCQSWAMAVDRGTYFLFGMAIAAGSIAAFGGRSIWPTVIAYVGCFVACTIFDKFLWFVARRAVNLMRMYVDRRQELFDESRR